MKKTESYIVFKVGDQSFSLAVQYVKGILELPRLFAVPQAPPYILGVVNVDGEVIPLIDTGIRLNMERVKASGNSAVIVLQRIHHAKTQRLCLFVDEVVEVLDLNELELQPLPTSRFEFDERLVNGMYKTEYDFVMQINVENFFKHNMEEIMAHAETSIPQSI